MNQRTRDASYLCHSLFYAKCCPLLSVCVVRSTVYTCARVGGTFENFIFLHNFGKWKYANLRKRLGLMIEIRGALFWFLFLFLFLFSLLNTHTEINPPLTIIFGLKNNNSSLSDLHEVSERFCQRFWSFWRTPGAFLSPHCYSNSLQISRESELSLELDADMSFLRYSGPSHILTLLILLIHVLSNAVAERHIIYWNSTNTR